VVLGLKQKQVYEGPGEFCKRTDKVWSKEGFDQLKENGTIKNDEDKRLLIVAKTNSKVWPVTKFLVPPDIDNVADGSVCHLLANEFHVTREQRTSWWNGSLDPRKTEVAVKKIVADKLSEKRSGAAQNMKKKFMGMSRVWTALFREIVSFCLSGLHTFLVVISRHGIRPRAQA
jgi:hypothetical protein